MMNVSKLTGEDARSRRKPPTIPPNSKIGQPPPPRAFDAVAYAAVLEVLG
ncbi:MAG TPA: hypothetical protein VJ775_05345 [Sphingomicrobium sp.]|jgi:hypothetical protein|nr:hypothetical protein [Sphingomicrobium sp.]